MWLQTRVKKGAYYSVVEMNGEIKAESGGWESLNFPVNISRNIFQLGLKKTPTKPGNCPWYPPSGS